MESARPASLFWRRLRATALPATLLLALATGCAASGGNSVPGAAAESAPDSAATGDAGDLRQRLAQAVSARQQQGQERQAHSGAGDYLTALYARRNNDLGTAAEYMDRALAADPYNPALMSATMMLMASEGRMNRAFELAELLAEASPDQAPAALLLAARAIAEGRPGEAQERLAILSTSGLGALVVPMMGGWAAAAEGDAAKAVEQLAPLYAIDGFDTLASIHTGLVRDIAGEEALASQAYNEALNATQGLPLRLALIVGNFLERTGERDLALQLYENVMAAGSGPQILIDAHERALAGAAAEAIVSNPREGAAEALFNLSSLLAQEGGEDTALVYLRTALYLRPELVEAQLLLAEILHSQGRLDETVATYRGIPIESPYYDGVQLELAEALYEKGEVEAAIEVLSEVGARDSEDPSALERLGDIYRAESRFEEAAEAYGEAVARLEQVGTRDWALFYFQGIALERSDRWAEAEAAFLRALELRPEQPYVMNYLAYSWVEQGENLEEALDMLERAVEQRPEDGYIVDSLGWVFYRLGDYGKAVVYLERAVELRPQDPVINDHLGDAYWRVGRRKEARFQWQRALSLEPEEEEIVQIEEKLENGLQHRADAT